MRAVAAVGVRGWRVTVRSRPQPGVRRTAMPDPTPFLSTITGASAGLVAIVGGLLVNRFVGLDSEQQGADRLLAQAEERLATARERAQRARAARASFEAARLLGNRDVQAAIRKGIRDVAELERSVELSTPLTAEALQPLLTVACEEYARACRFLDGVIVPADQLDAEEWASRSWEGFRASNRTGLPATEWPSMWEAAFATVNDGRLAARRELDAETRKQAESRDTFGIFSANLTPAAALRAVPVFTPESVGSALRRNRAAQAVERERGLLATEAERADQQVEDSEADVRRLRERRDSIVRPDKQLWIGLGVLLYPTVVGIVLPVLVLSGGPTAFTGWIRTLGVLFVTALAVLLGYLAYLATRLSLYGRGSRKPPAPRQEHSH
ncbi:hypothetical protein [Amycolatopsis sp. WGS_07]|uniref:hypothetical protein n=1 Tax=Amycolatopsis sp. WGS_07 TaxID=3076764 RepID=UPI00387398AF